ncbi:hypothetical protein NUACC21_17810 [Scytonema sp. NUACC21]
MAPVLHVGNEMLTITEVLPLMREYQIIPLSVKELVVKQVTNTQNKCQAKNIKLGSEKLA